MEIYRAGDAIGDSQTANLRRPHAAGATVKLNTDVHDILISIGRNSGGGGTAYAIMFMDRH